MPKKNFKSFGEMQGYEYLKGVISSVDGDTDTCTLSINGAEHKTVPIYYHCSEDAEELSNGAIEGSAAGFAEDDEVIVLKQREGLENKIFVVGHIDGAQPCQIIDVYVVVYFNAGSSWHWDYPTRLWVWNLPRNSLAQITDIDGNEITQPATSLEISGFMARQGIGWQDMSGSFSAQTISSEIWPWLETSPVVSHQCAMDGGEFLNYSNLSTVYSAVSTKPSFKRNIHNFCYPSYKISFYDDEYSCLVMDYIQEKKSAFNIETGTYSYQQYFGLDGVTYCEIPVGDPQTLTYTKSYDSGYINTHEIQTPLGATHLFYTGNKASYLSDGFATGSCGNVTPNRAEAVYSESDNLQCSEYHPDLGFCKDAYMTSYISTWYLISNSGPVSGGNPVWADREYTSERFFDITISAKYRAGVDPSTMSKADIIAVGRNTKLEDFVEEKLGDWWAENGKSLKLEGSGVGGYVTVDGGRSKLTIQLSLYGATAP